MKILYIEDNDDSVYMRWAESDRGLCAPLRVEGATVGAGVVKLYLRYGSQLGCSGAWLMTRLARLKSKS